MIYSIIYHKDYDVIKELYFRIVDEKQSFADLASQYSQGTEAKTKGIVGPVELAQLPNNIAKLLTSYPPKTILSPQIGKYNTLLQLELFMPAKFDLSMRKRMLQELFQKWLKKKVKG